MITSNNIKRAISAFLCVLLLTGMFVLGGTNACAETPKGLDGYAKAEENACDTRFDAPNATAQEVKNLAGGGVFYIINNLGGTHPYAYKHNFGKFMENGFMLEFSDYFNESSTTSYYGYGTLLIMLCKDINNDEYYRFNPGVVGVMIDFANGRVCLVESTMKILEYPFDVPVGDTFHKVKQVILESDAVKVSHVMDAGFKVYFVPHGDDLRFVLDIEGAVVSGDIDGDILKSYKYCPSDKTYVSIGSIDGNYHEWNEWQINFYGYKNLNKAPVTKDGATTYFDGKVPVSDKNIQFTGRWENNGKTATAYYQSSLEFKFTGNFIKIDTSKPVIASVDGGPWKKVGAGLNTVASGLERGEHTLRVMSTPDNPNPVIKGFYIAPEQKTVKTTAKKKIMFIGDKGALCSKKFEESYMLGISQKLDCSIAATVSNVGAKELCTSYFKLDEAGTKSYTADTSTDCIVLSLNTTGGKADYTQLVSVLRKNYPNSSIVCVAPASAKNASDIKSIVAGEQKDGDKKIFFVNADEWEVELSSDGVTPTADGAKTITSKLSSILKKIVGGNAVVNVTSKKPTTNTKDDKTSSVEQETTNDENEVVEEIVEEIVEEEVVQGNTVADYLWIIILVAVVVILSLLVIIFWPNIKKLFAAKK